MPSYEDLLRHYTSAAAQVLRPLVRETCATLGLPEGTAEAEKLGEAMARAFMEGATVGESEVAAQIAEQGGNVKINRLRAPE
jgi:hypothetical protein